MEPMFLKLAEPLRLATPSIEACFLLQGQPKGDWLMTMNYDESSVDLCKVALERAWTRSTANSS